MRAERGTRHGVVALGLLAGGGLLAPPVASQGQPSTPAAAPASTRAADADPAFERRVMAIADLLRCLVCQNQTIADSNAELAVDLKQQIREQLRAGASEAQIMQFMVDRYGEFVLYKPPLNGATMALWFGPAVLAVAAAIGVIVLVRRRRSVAEPALSGAEVSAADGLLGRAPASGSPSQGTVT